MDKIKNLELLQEEVLSAYNRILSDNGINIDQQTGIWKNAPGDKELRFATMPYIGSNYQHAKIKILFVGMDIGRDEGGLDCGNTIVNFDYRRECFASTKPITFPIKAANAHTSGTIVAALHTLKDSYPEYYSFIKDRANIQNRSTILQLRKAITPKRLDVLDNVAQTNFYKFVTKDREPRFGGNDRRFWGDERSAIEKILLEEVKILDADIVWFQGKSQYHNVIKELKHRGVKVIESWHPSYRRACTLNYVLELFKKFDI